MANCHPILWGQFVRAKACRKQKVALAPSKANELNSFMRSQLSSGACPPQQANSLLCAAIGVKAPRHAPSPSHIAFKKRFVQSQTSVRDLAKVQREKDRRKRLVNVRRRISKSAKDSVLSSMSAQSALCSLENKSRLPKPWLTASKHVLAECVPAAYAAASSLSGAFEDGLRAHQIDCLIGADAIGTQKVYANLHKHELSARAQFAFLKQVTGSVLPVPPRPHYLVALAKAEASTRQLTEMDLSYLSMERQYAMRNRCLKEKR
jgi:hypothetical protein